MAKKQVRVATIKAGKYLAQKNQWPVTKTKSYRLGRQQAFCFFRVGKCLFHYSIYFLDIAGNKQS